jgi:hypothetical protein
MLKTIFYSALLAVTIAGTVTGCASVPLDPGAENVKVVNGSVPKSCKVLGAVNSQDINGATVSVTSHENLMQMQLNSIRNQANKLGANLVLLTKHQTTYGYNSVDYGPTNNEHNSNNVNTHEMNGQAYQCNAITLSKLNTQADSTISAARPQ